MDVDGCGVNCALHMFLADLLAAAEGSVEAAALPASTRQEFSTLVPRLPRLSSSPNGLGGAVQKYNDLVGTVEGRVLPGARKFVDLGIGGNRTPAEMTVVDRVPRQLAHSDLLAALPAALPEGTKHPEETR